MRLSRWWAGMGVWMLVACVTGSLLNDRNDRAAAQEAPLLIKKVPALAEPALRLPRGLTYEAMRRKWGIDAWWAITTTRANIYEATHVGNGISVALLSPELIAGLTNRQALTNRMSNEEVQALYADNLRRYYGDKIVFSGYIQLDPFAYTDVDPIDSDWTFALTTEDGKRFTPFRVQYSKFQYHDLNDEGTSLLRKAVTVMFDNYDPATRQPILTPNTPSLTFEFAGKPGQVRARFVFDRKRKHR